MVGKDESLFQSTLHIFHDIIYETRKTINLREIENLGIYYHELKDVRKETVSFRHIFKYKQSLLFMLLLSIIYFINLCRE